MCRTPLTNAFYIKFENHFVAKVSTRQTLYVPYSLELNLVCIIMSPIVMSRDSWKIVSRSIYNLHFEMIMMNEQSRMTEGKKIENFFFYFDVTREPINWNDEKYNFARIYIMRAIIWMCLVGSKNLKALTTFSVLLSSIKRTWDNSLWMRQWQKQHLEKCKWKKKQTNETAKNIMIKWNVIQWRHIFREPRTCHFTLNLTPNQNECINSQENSLSFFFVSLGEWFGFA